MTKFNSDTLFTYLRRAPFGGRLTEEQKEGVENIIHHWNHSPMPVGPEGADLRHLAYILATAFHETGGTMAPVREGFSKSDAAARKKLSAKDYAKEDPITKQAYYGRGYVQLTWAENYKRFGKMLGIDLYKKPDLALEKDVSAKILVEGMLRGSFTGKGLSTYFNDTADTPKQARRVVNGTDKADLIAGYHAQILAALLAADERTPLPGDVSKETATPDGANMATDKTTLGAITGAIGAGSAGLLAAVNNPWAFGAVVILLIGGFLFLTGRLEIRRKAGA